MPDHKFAVQKAEEKEDWLLSYADMITLLMSFFILLLSMSHIDPVMYEKVQNGMAKQIGKHETAQPIQDLKAEITDTMKALKLDDGKMSLGADDRGLVLDMDGGSFFEPASAQLRPEMLDALQQMAAKLAEPRYSIFQIEVQGHTDDTPVSTPLYPSNWELSADRAATVVRFFIQNGLQPTRLSAAGFADTRPKVSNRDVNGNPLPVNQAVNRRVSIHIYPR